MITGQDPLFVKISAKFEDDIIEILRPEAIPSKATVNRSHSRPILHKLIETVTLQGEIDVQLQVIFHISKELYDINEIELSKEMYEIALNRSNSHPNKLKSVCLQVEAMHGMVMCDYKDLSSKNCSLDAPMVVSQYLRCLATLRSSLDIIFDLSTSQQEETAWKVLNACKLIYQIGQPLVFHYCGKYVVDTLLYAASCMESIITLCTVRHLKFRMKIYNTAFNAMMSHGSVREADIVLSHTTTVVMELKMREELDPPIPDKIKEILSRACDDVRVMTTVFKFFENPDDIGDILMEDRGDVDDGDKFGQYSKMNNMVHGEKMLCECIRVHHLTRGQRTKRGRSVQPVLSNYFQN